MPANTTKPAFSFRIKDLPLLYLQAARYAPGANDNKHKL
jgi:hypothetical protein